MILEKIEYEVSIDDLINFNLFSLWDAPENKLTRIRIIIFYPVLFSIFITVLYYFTPQEQPIPKPYGLLIILGFILLFFVTIGRNGFRNSYEKRLRKSYQKGKNLTIMGKKTIMLKEHCISASSEYGESEIKWEVYEKYVFTNDYLFIYPTVSSGYVIPMKFINDEQKVRVDNILKSKIKNR